MRDYENTIKVSNSVSVAGMSACEMPDEMARDEARHGKALEGLLKRYFG